jgi:hypothetical protein
MSITDKFKNWKHSKRVELLEELLEIHYSIGDEVPYPDPPAFDVCWHDTPEEIHRAYWTPMAEASGFTYDDLMTKARTGVLADGSPVEITREQELNDIRTQQCWGFSDHINHRLHFWVGSLPYGEPRTEELLHTMIASEIAHLAPRRHRNEQLEQYRALQMACVSRAAKAVLTDALARLQPATSQMDDELRDQLWDTLAGLDVEPTDELVKTWVAKIPRDLHGLAMMHGWGDTEVRDALYVFVKAQLGKA